MLLKSPVFLIFYVIGWIFGTSASAVLLTSAAGLILRRYRRRLAAAVSVLSWIILVSGAGCLSAYLYEIATVAHSSNPYEKFTFFHMGGGYAWVYWVNIIGTLVPQLFWIRRCRTNLWWSFSISLLTFIPIYSERIMLYLTWMQGYVPDSWMH